MPEEPELELKELQEKVHEAHAESGAAWTRGVAVSTAALAVLAALGALQSGALVNEAMIAQLKASDAWNEYQASRQKAHLYEVAAATLVDSRANPRRAAGYAAEVTKENAKAGGLSKRAGAFEAESERMMREHHRFAYEVALCQVAIALAAISALTRTKWLWLASCVLGLAGAALFVAGFLG